MSVLRYYDCITLCIRILGSLVCNINLISDLCLVLCCDIYRSTLISIMYPSCMIIVHDHKSRALHPCDSLTSLLDTVIWIPEPGYNLTHVACPCFMNLITREVPE